VSSKTRKEIVKKPNKEERDNVRKERKLKREKDI